LKSSVSTSLIILLKSSLISLIFEKNEKLIDIVYEYILDKNIEMDSMSFYYLIMSALNFNSFVKAYNLFVQVLLAK